eukprot:g25793.t1
MLVLPNNLSSFLKSARTSTLRWQVAQSRHMEIMAIGEIFLELLQPVDEERTIVKLACLENTAQMMKATLNTLPAPADCQPLPAHFGGGCHPSPTF